jgi:hypothetical protein
MKQEIKPRSFLREIRRDNLQIGERDKKYGLKVQDLLLTYYRNHKWPNAKRAQDRWQAKEKKSHAAKRRTGFEPRSRCMSRFRKRKKKEKISVVSDHDLKSQEMDSHTQKESHPEPLVSVESSPPCLENIPLVPPQEETYFDQEVWDMIQNRYPSPCDSEPSAPYSFELPSWAQQAAESVSSVAKKQWWESLES